MFGLLSSADHEQSTVADLKSTHHTRSSGFVTRHHSPEFKSSFRQSVNILLHQTSPAISSNSTKYTPYPFKLL